MPLSRVAHYALRWFFFASLTVLVRAEPVEFNLPSQPLANALLAFSKQAKIEVLFSYDQLRQVQSKAVAGYYEPENALVHLIGDPRFTIRRDSKGKFVVTTSRAATGSIQGRFLTPNGNGADSARVTILETRQSTRTNKDGEFQFESVPAGTYRLTATNDGYQRFQLDRVTVTVGAALILEAKTLLKPDELTRLDPLIVQGKAEPPRPFARSLDALPPRNSVGNIDLPRTENDALPFTIYDREQITRSGVVGLNEFLKRSVLESDGATQAPEADDSTTSIPAGSNLTLRGFDKGETVVLVNGRRLPDVLTSDTRTLGPDVNYIPLSLIQQVEVLPVSASALYSGNAVGGVINIILRPNVEATEINATYTNAAQGYDAPQSSLSFLHGQSLLGGKLHLRLNATFTRSTPPAESELGYHQARTSNPVPLDAPLYRATPNIRSEDNSALIALGKASVTSVAPGANGTGGLAAFANRDGVRNFDLFDSPGGMAASIYSRDYTYGRSQQRSAYFGSLVYDVVPWMQLGLDATTVKTTVNRGADILNADLTLSAASLLNPFGQEVKVSLNEISPQLGNNYSEARIELSSFVLGVLFKLPANWQVSFDTQYSRNTTQYRGLALPNLDHWQQLIDDGRYNPLRDSQIGGPPAAFYDRVLVYYGGRGRFVTLGDFDNIDGAVRVTNRKLSFPTGPGAVNVGGDYRRSSLAPYTQELRFGDDTLAEAPVRWTGRTLQRYSAFGEMQAPLVPARWLPHWLKKIETDLAVRYVAADTAAETNVAPTFALKVDFAGGFSLRGSLTTSNRFLTPQMSQKIGAPGGSGGIGSDTIESITDPRRNNERYDIVVRELINTGLTAENSVTQTAGAVWQQGEIHRLRLAVDFVDTQKVNEIVNVPGAQDILYLESTFPTRVIRQPLAAGDPREAGRATTALTGILNLAARHSQNWSTSLDYVWTGFLGGTFESYGRWLYFQRYDRQLVPARAWVDELSQPDGTTQGLLKNRVNFGTSWSKPQYGFGVDGHYFSSRVLPEAVAAFQGSSQIKPYWQFDAFLQGDLGRWLPWKSSRYGLRGQFRVNNISGFDFPKYVNGPSSSGVQPYGDWRGRTYSISLTATF